MLNWISRVSVSNLAMALPQKPKKNEMIRGVDDETFACPTGVSLSLSCPEASSAA